MGTVILTRMAGLNQKDARLFQALGYQTVVLPLTEVSLRPLSAEMKQRLQASDWLFFTSQTPVAMSLAAGYTGKIAVIGQETAAVVRRFGYEPEFISPRPDRQSFLEAWLQQYPGESTVFYPKSQLADDFFESHLPPRITLTAVTAYDNQPPEKAAAQLARLLPQAEAIYFTSPSAWHRAQDTIRASATQLTLIAIGETTRHAIQAAGSAAVLLSEFKQNRQSDR